MCNKLTYCNPRIDKCLAQTIDHLNNLGYLKTLSSCCGHGVYNPTIVVKDKFGTTFEIHTGIILTPKKGNRYYKKDNDGYYYIPEVIKNV